MDLKTLAYKPVSDSALVRKSLDGSEGAFEALHRRYQGKAAAVARAHGLRGDVVDDVVQESFLLAFRDLEGLRSAERFGPWFLTIVRHAARSSLRKSRRADEVLVRLESISTRCDPTRPSLSLP